MFAWITTLLLPASFAVVGPVSLFVAVAFVYHRLTMDSELVIMQNAGISRLQLARPALLVAAAMVAIGYLVSLYLLPLAYRDYRDLKFQVNNNYSSVLIQEGVFSQMVPGVTVYVRKRDAPTARCWASWCTTTAGPTARSPRWPSAATLLPGDNRPAHGDDRRASGRSGAPTRAPRAAPVRSLRDAVHHASRSPASAGGRARTSSSCPDLFDPPEAAGGMSRYHQFRMEGHDRLTAPLMNLALPLVALALLLGAEFNRRGHMVRILIAVAIVAGLEAAMIGFKSLGRRIPELDARSSISARVATISAFA